VSALLDLLPRARALEGLTPAADALLADLLGQLLLMEGPPPAPIPDVSQDHRKGIIRSDKGRPICYAESWATGPWICLLLEAPSVGMKRPIPIKDSATGRIIQEVLDSKSQSFQKRVRRACLDLGLAEPHEDTAVFTILGHHRTFIAWRPREDDETFVADLRFDADNAAKNVLDGLQKAGVLTNDRRVMRLTASKECPDGWVFAPQPLEDRIREEALRLHADGLSLEAIQNQMRLAKAHMARLFPGAYARPRSARERNPQLVEAAADRALALILDGTPYSEAKRQAHALAEVLRPKVAAALRSKVEQLLDTHSPSQVAAALKMDLRTLKGIFRDHVSLAMALGEGKHTGERRRLGKQLQTAAEAVLAGTYSAREAAKHFRVNLNSLNTRLTKLRKARGIQSPHDPTRHQGSQAKGKAQKTAKASGKPSRPSAKRPAPKTHRTGPKASTAPAKTRKPRS